MRGIELRKETDCCPNSAVPFDVCIFATSFPGSSLFLPRESRKREDPGNEVGMAPDHDVKARPMFTLNHLPRKERGPWERGC